MTYTTEQLHTRLLEIADDPSWSIPLRGMAQWATVPEAAEIGFAIAPADLTDDAIREALREACLSRNATPGKPDDLDALRARIQRNTE